MTDSKQYPDLPTLHHPEHTMTWMESELRAIHKYARAYADATCAMRAAQPEPQRQYICPTESVADLVNNLLLLDQTLPIYAAQSITHDGKRRTITVPPIVSRERVKEGRWIGEGDELNAAVIWTRAAQPETAAVANPVIGCHECHITHDLGACATEAPAAVTGPTSDELVRLAEKCDVGYLQEGKLLNGLIEDGDLTEKVILFAHSVLVAYGAAPTTQAPQQEPIAVVTRFHDLGGEIDWTGRAIAPVGAKLCLAPQPGQSLGADVDAILSDLKQLASEVCDHTPDSFQRGVVRLANRAHALATQAPQPRDHAYREACSLAKSLFTKHFAHKPEYASGEVKWEMCDTTAGVISQIDNMVCRLVEPAVSQGDYLPLLVRDIANELGATSIQACKALKTLGFGDCSLNMAVTPRMARSLRKHFATQPQEAAPSQDAEDAKKWREHLDKLDTLVAHCPTCCQGFVATKEMTHDQIIFECGKAAGRGEAARTQAKEENP